MRENWCIFFQKRVDLHILMFSSFFLRAKCLMSAQQLAAEIKAVLRDGDVQMEGACSLLCL